jgi:antagonist of KipI
LRVVQPGLLTTVQDGGRHGWQQAGVRVGGALDALALRVANLLVGNAGGAAGLEATLRGPTLVAERDVLLALGGADLGATLDGAPVPPWKPFLARAGATLALGAATPGHPCRAYLAVAGGVDVPEVLGGRGTDLRGGFGGLEGRALRAGDVLPLGAASAVGARVAAELRAHGPVARWGAGREVHPAYGEEPTLRFLPGVEAAHFTEASHEALVSERFTVGPQSDRMGYRLQGPALQLRAPREAVSSPVAAGTVQVPPGGAPIVLLADRQTVGGYPRVAQVVTADLPLLAQLPPGAALRFREVSLVEAEGALLAQEAALRQLAEAVRSRGV